jgi:hypothetical protein
VPDVLEQDALSSSPAVVASGERLPVGFFKFRKSIRIAPGVRLSLGKRGLGLSAGVKGLRASIGSRGLGITTGIPGTGISHTSYLGGGGRSSGGRSAYRELQREQREQERERRAAVKAQEKAAALAAARTEHVAHEAMLQSLRTVLSGRTRSPFPWSEVVAPRGAFRRVEFREPAFEAAEAVIGDRTNRRHPIYGWGIGVVVGVAAALYCVLSAVAVAASTGGPVRWAGAGVFVLGALFALGFAAGLGLGLWRALARRPAERARVIEELREEHAEAVRRDTRAHEAAQDAAHAEWDGEEAAREVLRTAVTRGDAEPLAALLEDELSDEPFPVPVVCDVEFEGCSVVTITVELPELDDVPEERTSLTSTGKLSTKKMSQKDRVSIYEDLCCGVALRLAYEAFRVLPMVERVRVEGGFLHVDARGAEADAVALRFEVPRATFESLGLDRVDPSDCVRSIGAFSCSRRGELSPVA